METKNDRGPVNIFLHRLMDTLQDYPGRVKERKTESCRVFTGSSTRAWRGQSIHARA